MLNSLRKSVVAQRAEQHEQHQRAQHRARRQIGPEALGRRRRAGRHTRLGRCSQTASTMIPALTTRAAASGTPLASSV